ncbi:MAG: hypothetical protein LBB27_01640 [Tannerellaceae bacterium]|jgi:hypothetical protein|nr:hypothetical protein [Tannerellaceae bacterium]
MKTRHLLALAALGLPIAATSLERITLPSGASIHRIMEVAEEGDVILLKQGVHRTLKGFCIPRSLTFVGETSQSDGQGELLSTLAPVVSFDGKGHRVLFIGDTTGKDTPHVLLQNLIVAQGDEDAQGGGIYNYRADLDLKNVRITGNYANGQGGGIYNDKGFVRLIQSDVSGNSAFLANGGKQDGHFGGGIYNAPDSRMEIDSSSVDNNIASGVGSSAGHGGGIANAGRLIIRGSRIEGNAAGRLALQNEGTLFASHYGGGIWNGKEASAVKGGYLEVYNSLIDKNSAYQGGKGAGNGAFGGGIYNGGDTARLYDSQITSNYATYIPISTEFPIDMPETPGYGGGIYNETGAYLLLSGTPPLPLRPALMRVSSNIASAVYGDGFGGGIANAQDGLLYYSGTVLIEQNYALKSFQQILEILTGGTGWGGGLCQLWDKALLTNAPDVYTFPEKKGDTLLITNNHANAAEQQGEYAHGNDIWPDITLHKTIHVHLPEPDTTFFRYVPENRSRDIVLIVGGTVTFKVKMLGRYAHARPAFTNPGLDTVIFQEDNEGCLIVNLCGFATDVDLNIVPETNFTVTLAQDYEGAFEIIPDHPSATEVLNQSTGWLWGENYIYREKTIPKYLPEMFYIVFRTTSSGGYDLLSPKVRINGSETPSSPGLTTLTDSRPTYFIGLIIPADKKVSATLGFDPFHTTNISVKGYVEELSLFEVSHETVLNPPLVQTGLGEYKLYTPNSEGYTSELGLLISNRHCAGLIPVVIYDGDTLIGIESESAPGSFIYTLDQSQNGLNHQVTCLLPFTAVEISNSEDSHVVIVPHESGYQHGLRYKIVSQDASCTFLLQSLPPYLNVAPTVKRNGSSIITPVPVPGTVGFFSYTVSDLPHPKLAQTVNLTVGFNINTVTLPAPPDGFIMTSCKAGNSQFTVGAGTYHIPADNAFSFTLTAVGPMRELFQKEGEKIWPEVIVSGDVARSQDGAYAIRYELPAGINHNVAFRKNYVTVTFPDILPMGIDTTQVTPSLLYMLPETPFSFGIITNTFDALPPTVIVNDTLQPVYDGLYIYRIPPVSKDVTIVIERKIAKVQVTEPDKIELLTPSGPFLVPSHGFEIRFKADLTPRIDIQGGQTVGLTKTDDGIYHCMVKPGKDFIAVTISREGSASFVLSPPSYTKVVVDPSVGEITNEGFYNLPVGSTFVFDLQLQQPYESAVPIVRYGGASLTGQYTGNGCWRYSFSVRSDAAVDMDLDYREVVFHCMDDVIVSEAVGGKMICAPDGNIRFSVRMVYPNHETRPAVDAGGNPLVWKEVIVDKYETTYIYELPTTLAARTDITISLDSRVVTLEGTSQGAIFMVSAIELGKEKPWVFGTSMNVPAGERLGVAVTITDSKYADVRPGFVFNGVLMQPDSVQNGKYYYYVTVRENTSLSLGLNTVTVIFTGTGGNGLSLVEPTTETTYVTPGARLKFRLKTAYPYTSIAPSVRVRDGEYLTPTEVAAGSGLYDFSYTISNRLTPVYIDAKISSYKVVFSVLDPGVELTSSPNIVYLPQTTNGAPCMYAFTLKVDDRYAYVTPQVTVGTKQLHFATRNNNVYTYILSDIRENLLVDIRMVYARLHFSLSQEVAMESVGQMVQPDGYYYLHSDSSFAFSLRVLSGSLIDAPAVIAETTIENEVSTEVLRPQPLGKGIFAYSFKAKRGDTKIKVDPYRGITFGSDIPADITLRSHSRGTHYVPAGSNFEFTLEVKSSYRNVVPTVTVTGNSGEQAILVGSNNEKNLYRFSLPVKDDATLHFSLQTLTLRFAEIPTGVTLLSNLGSFVQVPVDGTFTFAVQVDNAHSSIQPYVSAGSNPVTLVSTDNATHTYTYAVTAKTSSTVFVSLSTNAVLLSVELPDGMELAGNNGEGTHHLSYGQSFSFSVRKSSALDDYLRPIAHAVTANKTWEILPIVSGEYFNFSLQEVTANTEILVNVNYRTLTLPTPPAGLILLHPAPGAHTVGVGGSFSFSLKAVDGAFAYLPPTVISRNDISYLFDAANGIHYYTLKALYDDNLRFDLNYVSLNVEIASDGVALVSPAGDILYGKQTFYVPVGRDYTLTFDLLLKEGDLNSRPTIVVDQAELVSPTEVSAGVYEATISNMMKNKDVKVFIPRYTIAKTVGISFLIADGVKVSLSGYEYRSMAQYSIQQGDPCLFYFQTDEPYQDAEVVLRVNGTPYEYISLGGGNYAVNLGLVSSDKNIQILMGANKNTDILPPADEVKIVANGNRVVVECETETPISVYTLTGRLHLQRLVSGEESFTLPAGIYIIRTDKEVIKLRIGNR